MTTNTEAVGAFAPLRISIFRALWLASLVSSIGSWMQTVGAQWLLIDQPNSAALVALVQTASSAPFLLLGLPAGVIGEFLNRRSLLIGVQAFQVVVGVVLTVLTAAGSMTPALLLILTFLLGAGAAVQLPAYQALIPELVPRPLIPSAAALSSIGINIARAIGPALAGLVVGALGVPWVFALNALSFAFFLVVLLAWRGYTRPAHRSEGFVDASRSGLRYVRNSRVVRRFLLRLTLFVVPANALWALLPLVATDRLHLESGGYGLLLAALGVGSIGGAFILPRMRARLGLNMTTVIAAAVFGAGLIATTLSGSLALTLVVLVVVGVAWILIIASFNGAVQAFLPGWVRSRGISVYQLVFFGSTAVGSAIAGLLAQLFGVTPVNVAAGAILLLVAASQIRWPLLKADEVDRTATVLPLSDVSFIPENPGESFDNASTLVLVTYVVPAERQEEFLALMRRVEASRRRTGSRRWDLYRRREEPDTFTEAFVVGSWQEHLDQHETRQTGYDTTLLRDAAQFSTKPLVVEHLLSTEIAR